MKLLGSTEKKITKDKKKENVPSLEITEVVLVCFNFVNKNYQQDLRVLHVFVLNKSFGQLLETSPKKITFVKIFKKIQSFCTLRYGLLIKILSH